MVEDYKDKYSFGQQSITQPLKLNQPFTLYNWRKKELLWYYNITYIDSLELKSLIGEEIGNKPVLFNFENEGSRRNDSQHVKLQTEYRLFTYLNNTKYYLNKRLRDSYLELRSTESKNTVKGSLHI